ncbi:MAG TPA: L,D-transpeptidase [Aggregatilineales bacterium]|nr:L,D-transpeptidase [Aggregatilineales bacterium]
MKRIILVLVVLITLIPIGSVAAFPGDEVDERCDTLVQQALDMIAQGQEVEQPDCLLNTGLSPMEIRAAEAEMRSNPVPNVVQVPPDDSIVHERRFRRLNGHVEIYDAPNGNVIGAIDAGYNYVSIVSAIEGWVQIRPNQWVHSDVVTDADISEFGGVEIHAPLERPFAWMLAPAKPSLFPGGPEHEAYEKIPRYTVLNIYGVEIVNGWEWYLIGPDQWIQQIRVAKVKPVARPTDVAPDEQWIAVDLFEQTAVAYEGDNMVFASLISSGLPQWSTNEGLFKIYQRWVYGPMTGASGQRDFYYIENIPNIMYFDNDIALHAAYWHDRFGYRQSHGCVNLSLMDAWWLYEWTRADEDTWVYVYSSDDYRYDLPGWAIRPR